MGSPVSPVLADNFLEDFEGKVLVDQTICLRMCRRFVDDVIAVVQRNKADSLLNHLNKQHPNIQFTMVGEKAGSLLFMDVRFTRNTNGKLNREVYQKETHTNRYIQFKSHHPHSVKSGVIAGLVNRAITVSNDEALLKDEIKRIEGVMAQNGYPQRFVEKAIGRQMKRSNMGSKRVDSEETPQESANIPFVDRLSQEIRRIVRPAGIRYPFFVPDST